MASVWCRSVVACIATGSTNAGTLAERLSGTTWRVLHTPNPRGTVGDFLGSLSCTSLSACTGAGLAFGAPAFSPRKPSPSGGTGHGGASSPPRSFSEFRT